MSKSKKQRMPVWAWLIVAPVILFVIVLLVGSLSDPASEKSKKRAAVDLCWERYDSLISHAEKNLMKGACQILVDQYEKTYEPSATLRRR